MEASTRELAVQAALSLVADKCGMDKHFRVEVTIDDDEAWVVGESIDGNVYSVAIFAHNGAWTYTNATLVEDDEDEVA